MIRFECEAFLSQNISVKGKSRTAATSKMELFVIIVLPAVNYYHKVLHLGYCSSPRSTSEIIGRVGKV